jgi:hypothetical protein
VLRVLSSKTEPSSLQTSYDEPSVSNIEEDYGYMQVGTTATNTTATTTAA